MRGPDIKNTVKYEDFDINCMARSIYRVTSKSLEFDRRAVSDRNDTRKTKRKTIPQSQEKLCFAWDVSKLVPDLSSTGSPLSGP